MSAAEDLERLTALWERLSQLTDAPDWLSRPLPLLALLDQADAEVDPGPLLAGLRDVIAAFHTASRLRALDQHEAALALVDAGLAGLRQLAASLSEAFTSG